ncbi:hypothetical protein ACN28S_32035 [Cystobacter fuscus]
MKLKSISVDALRFAIFENNPNAHHGGHFGYSSRVRGELATNTRPDEQVVLAPELNEASGAIAEQLGLIEESWLAGLRPLVSC